MSTKNQLLSTPNVSTARALPRRLLLLLVANLGLFSQTAQAESLEQNAELLKGRPGDVVFQVAFTPEGEYVAAAGMHRQRGQSNRGVLSVWRRASGELVFRDDQLPFLCGRIDFSPGANRLIAISCADWSIVLFRYRTDRNRRFEAEVVGRIPQVVEKTDRVMMSDLVRFSPDGRMLAFTGPSFSNKGNVLPLTVLRVCPTNEFGSGREAPINSRNIRSFVFLTDSEILMSGEGVRRISIEPARPLSDVADESFPKEVASISASANRSRIAFMQNGAFSVVGMPARSLLAKVEYPTASLFDLAISPDGAFLVTSDMKQMIRLWKVESGKQVQEWRTSVTAPDVAFSPDGKAISCAGSDSADIRLLDITADIK